MITPRALSALAMERAREPIRPTEGRTILLVTPTFFPEKVGTPHYVTDLVDELVRQGWTVRVITGQPYYPAFRRFDGYGRNKRRDHVAGARVLRVPTVVPRRGHPILRAVSEVNFLAQVAWRRLTGTIRSHDRVIAVSPGVPFALIAGALCRARGGRLVALIHDIQSGLMPSGRLAKVAERVERWSMERADRVAVLAPNSREALRAMGVRAPIEVAPLWPTVAGDASQPADPDLVLYSGNLGRKQGVRMLAELGASLLVRRPSARLLIRGDGSERADLEHEIRERGLDNVTFDGFVEADQLATSLAEGAVHVVPQLPEGATAAMPSKVYNVLAVGRPLVAYASAASGLATLADAVPAVIRVEPGDLDRFVDAVVKLLADPAHRMQLGEQGRAYVERVHDRRTAVSDLAAMTDP